MKLRIDGQLCVGHGRCYVLAPELFEEDERGYSVVAESEISPTQADQARRAEQNCPEQAIVLTDE